MQQVSDGSQSLLQYLRAKNPEVHNRSTSRGWNTTNRKYEWPVYIELWEDFDLQSLMSIYDGLLKGILSKTYQHLPDFSKIPKLPFCEIHDERSLVHLLAKWNQSVVSHALEVAQDDLHSQEQWTSERTYMVSGGQARNVGNERDLEPDWAAVQKHPDSIGSHSKPENMLPGDTKLSGKWSSGHIKRGDVGKAEGKNWMRPIKQVYTYCSQGGGRYGYIITDRELVAIRIKSASSEYSQNDFSNIPDVTGSQEAFEPPEDTAQERAKAAAILQYKSVPWSTMNSTSETGSGRLTVNLALWWLHIMAASDNTIEEDYGSLKDAKIKTTAATSIATTPALTSPATITPVDQSFSISEFDPPSTSATAQSFSSVSSSRRKRSRESEPVRKGKRRSGHRSRD